MRTLDGARGEGGGQILRSALTLSLLTGTPVRLVNIRARRSRPGLRPQHLTAVRAAKAVGGARVEGDALGSTQLTFHPGPVRPGRYHFVIPTAGAATLVLQTVLLPLALADGPSTVRIEGGTHVPWSPPYEYLAWQYLPFLERLGVRVELKLIRAGFHPRGGGILEAEIAPVQGPLRPLRLEERGRLLRIRGLSAVANLPDAIAQRQRDRALARLRGLAPEVRIDLERLPSPGKGTVAVLLAEGEGGSGCVSALGAPRKPAEKVADEAADALLAYLASGAAVDAHLADQLLLPLALADGPSVFTAERATEHLRTHAWVVEQFLPVEVRMEEEGGRVWVEVGHKKKNRLRGKGLSRGEGARKRGSEATQLSESAIADVGCIRDSTVTFLRQLSPCLGIRLD